MERQTFLSRKWQYFCQDCDCVDYDGPGATGLILCQTCWKRRERSRAVRLGFEISDSVSDDDVLKLLDTHEFVCEYLSLVWNRLLSRAKHQPTWTDGKANPWQAHAAHWVPARAIDELAVELMSDLVFAESICDVMLRMRIEGLANSKWEVDARYETEQLGIEERYWPAVPNDKILASTEPIVWNRWHQYLPLRAV